MYARIAVTSMCKYIHAHAFVPLALLALACPDACIFVSCFFALAGLSTLPFADFHFFTWLGNGDRQLRRNLFSFSDESVSR